MDRDLLCVVGSVVGLFGFVADRGDHLHALLYEVVAEPLDHHVALPGCHWLVVDADHQRLPGLLQGDAPRSLPIPSAN